MTRQSFIMGAAILTLAGVAVRFIGAFFRIFLAMLIGDEGMGLFQMAYPIYSVLLAVSTAGLPVAISKLVAENIARGNPRGAYHVFRIAALILAALGLLISVLLYLGAGFFAGAVARDPRAYYPIISIAPAIFIVTVMSSLRGFFQGRQQMMPTALSQIAEQTGRVAVALLLALYLLPQGLAMAAAGAGFGTTAGAVCGFLVLLLIWLRDKPAYFRTMDRARPPERETTGSLVRRIFALSVPITLGALVMPLLSMVDLFIVPLRLHAAGFDTQRATALYGQLTGMAAPVIHIPTIITVSLAVSLVPAISEALALQRLQLVRERAFLAFRFTMLLSLPAALGLYLLAEPITVLLFDNAEAGKVLAVLSTGVIFLTLYQTTSGILQGLGRTMDPVISLFWGAAVKTVLTLYLTSVPALHIRGAALGTVAGFAVAALLNLYKVQIRTGMPLRPWQTVGKPLLATLGMGWTVILLYRFLESLRAIMGPDWAGKAATAGSVAGGALVYGLLLFVLGGINNEDLRLIPWIGPRLARWAAKFALFRG